MLIVAIVAFGTYNTIRSLWRNTVAKRGESEYILLGRASSLGGRNNIVSVLLAWKNQARSEGSIGARSPNRV